MFPSSLCMASRHLRPGFLMPLCSFICPSPLELRLHVSVCALPLSKGKQFKTVRTPWACLSCGQKQNRANVFERRQADVPAFFFFIEDTQFLEMMEQRSWRVVENWILYGSTAQSFIVWAQISQRSSQISQRSGPNLSEIGPNLSEISNLLFYTMFSHFRTRAETSERSGRTSLRFRNRSSEGQNYFRNDLWGVLSQTKKATLPGCWRASGV